MNTGEICARHYASGRAVMLSWRDGRISRVEEVHDEKSTDLWVAPALVDLQVNGFAGVDFQRDEVGMQDLLAASERLREAGCGGFLLTLVTDEWPRLTARLRRLGKLRAQSEVLEATIAGWHIEGPFLSAEAGYHGAHDPGLMRDPTVGDMEELREIAGSDLLLVTLAPERAGALAAIKRAVSLGIKVSLGHTNASAEVLRQAVEAGATGFTHLGNACPQLLDRHDNILWRVLETPGLKISVIPDGIHVSPALFRLIHRVLSPDKICYITDAMAAAGMGPGRYTSGKLVVEVGEDEVVRHPGRLNFAGSALRPIDGVFRAARMLNQRWQDVWDHFSTRPAEFLGLPHRLEEGEAARFCILRVKPGDTLSQVKVHDVLSPSIHKFADELMASGLSTE
jgi:N-acetylglucosamine-6-phosphate deacetylase